MAIDSQPIASLDMSRIAIIGSPGSGKTTFSIALGKILCRPIVHLDRHLWQSGWVLPTEQQRDDIHGNIVAEDCWIIDGMWRGTLPARLDRATLVIFLDYNRLVCYGSVVRRYLCNRGRQRSDMAVGCMEKLDKSFLEYTWSFNSRIRPDMVKLINMCHVDMVHLTSRRQAKAWLSMLQCSL